MSPAVWIVCAIPFAVAVAFGLFLGLTQKPVERDEDGAER